MVDEPKRGERQDLPRLTPLNGWHLVRPPGYLEFITAVTLCKSKAFFLLRTFSYHWNCLFHISAFKSPTPQSVTDYAEALNLHLRHAYNNVQSCWWSSSKNKQKQILFLVKHQGTPLFLFCPSLHLLPVLPSPKSLRIAWVESTGEAI